MLLCFEWSPVRIHLDQVDGLGSFIEFEAVVGDIPADLDDSESESTNCGGNSGSTTTA